MYFGVQNAEYIPHQLKPKGLSPKSRNGPPALSAFLVEARKSFHGSFHRFHGIFHGFHGSFHRIHGSFHGNFHTLIPWKRLQEAWKLPLKLLPRTVFVEASRELAPTESSMKASTEVNHRDNFHGSFHESFHQSFFHGSFHESFHGNFHGSLRGSKLLKC